MKIMITINCLSAGKETDGTALLFSSANKKDADAFRQRLLKLIVSASFETMTITPLMAEVMLEFNTGNRALSRKRMLNYGKEMKSGNWKLTGEPIIFSKEGVLNDGQTRLRACISSGMSFRTDVRFGIERAAFDVTGVGAKRTLADVLSIKGEEGYSLLAASLAWLGVYERGGSLAATRTISSSDGQDILDRNPDIRKSLSKGSRLYSQTRFMEPSLSVFLHYIFSLKDADSADEFFDILTTGIGVTDTKDVMFLLRKRLTDNAMNKAKIGSVETAALVIKAWNSKRSKKPISILKWANRPADGITAEEFPRAV